ncbi:hypothetical protein HORIV_61210 [Vreelandella olivaria]|uniref:Uncharacterized protein n=1 Tax=Vreelandella olivaria TaxID=390919 RepID=A0ABM7GSQ2_9GAMM|nr:hypothetical protein HORIV_61210 [Halomonas olivaria]
MRCSAASFCIIWQVGPSGTRGGVPLAVLAGAEVGLVKHFLKAQYLYALISRLLNHRQMRFVHRITDGFGFQIGAGFQTHLNQADFHFLHETLPLIVDLKRV